MASGIVTNFLYVLRVFVVKYYYKNGAGRGSAWLERDVRDVEVGGSNPLAPTNNKENKNNEEKVEISGAFPDLSLFLFPV